MHFQIDHLIRFTYDEPAPGLIQLLRLTPKGCDSQQVLDWRIDVNADGYLSDYTDVHGNACHIFYADRGVEDMCLRVTGRVWTADSGGLVTGIDEPLPPIIYRRQTPLTGISDSIAAFADRMKGGGALADGHALMMAIHERVIHETGVTDIVADADSTLRLGRGVSQDLAHLFIASARHLGYPCRFVSGHLASLEEPGQESAHYWAEMHVPGRGWVAFDPSHGLCGTEAYIRVAVGLDWSEASPVRSSRRGGGYESIAMEATGQRKKPLNGSGRRQNQSQ